MVAEEGNGGKESGPRASSAGTAAAGTPVSRQAPSVPPLGFGTSGGYGSPAGAARARGKNLTQYWFGSGKRLPESAETALRVKAHLRLGEWRRSLVESRVQEVAGPDTASGVGVGGVTFPAGRRIKSGRKFSGDDDGPVGAASAFGAGSPHQQGEREEREHARQYSPEQATRRIEQLMSPVLGHLRVARACGATRYGPWHAWALANFYSAQQLRRAKAPGRVVARYASAAVSGFGHSIVLGRAQL